LTPKATGSYLYSVFQKRPFCSILRISAARSSRLISSLQGLTSHVIRDFASTTYFLFLLKPYFALTAASAATLWVSSLSSPNKSRSSSS